MSETKITANKKAVIYCRVSTKEQVDEGNSLISQERLCREYALKEGFDIIEVFIEKGESAKTAKRKELNRLLTFCTTKKDSIQAVIAYKVDRISRNMTDYSNIKVRLKKWGVVIKSVTEFFEDTPAGRFMENIIANVGQFDNDVRTERSIGGMKEATQEGRYVWTAPLGYSNAKVDGKSTIVPNSTAPLIREVFERIALRIESTNAIRLKMAEEGLVNKKGAPVTCSNFFHLLRNPLYKGKIKKFGQVYQGTFDPIVAEELFDEVQMILKGKMNKVKHYVRENPDFPLRRFVTNMDGKQLTGYWSQGKRLKYPYYSFHLPGTTIRKEMLEQKFKDLLARYTFDSTQLKVMRNYLIKHFIKRQSIHSSDRGTIEKRVAEIDSQIDNLIKLESAGSISTVIFTDRVRKLDTESQELKSLLRKREINDVNITQLLAFATEVLKKPYMLWEKAPLATQKRLQVFDFPDGLIFDGVDFRTPKVCSIFKVKELIDSQVFSRVSSKYTGKNTLYKTNLPPSGQMLLNNKVFWEEVVSNLLDLKCIIAGKPQKSSDESLEDEYELIGAD